jgi:hypothetical protein
MKAVIKLLGLCLVALFAVCSIAAAEASAAEDIYKVGGEKIEAGETIEIEASAKTEFTLTAEETILETKIKAIIKCKKLKLNAGEHPEIIGGVPGTSAKEKIEFEECSATLGGVKCEKVTVESALANNELVKIISPSSKAGDLATLFTPASGKVFMTAKLTKCGIFGSHEAKVEGTTVARTVPEGVFEPEGTWIWNEKEEITEIEKSNGTKEKVGLKSSSNPTLINGEANVRLAPPKFRAEGAYPFAFEGKNAAGTSIEFNFKNNHVEFVPECSKVKFTGTLAAASTTLVSTPNFETCEMRGEATAVSAPNCSVQWIVTRQTGPRKYAGELVLANSGMECRLTAVAKGVETGCEFFVTGQGFSSGMVYERIEGTPKQVEARFTLTGVIFTTNGNANCKNLGTTGEIKGRVKFEKMLVS